MRNKRRARPIAALRPSVDSQINWPEGTTAGDRFRHGAWQSALASIAKHGPPSVRFRLGRPLVDAFTPPQDGEYDYDWDQHDCGREETGAQRVPERDRSQ